MVGQAEPFTVDTHSATALFEVTTGPFIDLFSHNKRLLTAPAGTEPRESPEFLPCRPAGEGFDSCENEVYSPR